MHVRVFNLRFNPASDRFDDEVVAGFLADNDVLSIRDHFFLKDDVPYLNLVVRFRATALPVSADSAPWEQIRDDSRRKLIKEADWPLFNTFRAWRSERSKQEGIPPYVICNNRQLAEITRGRPQTLAARGRIEGFGEGDRSAAFPCSQKSLWPYRYPHFLPPLDTVA